MGSFVAGISVFCFAASYAVSLMLELTRFWFKSGIRGAVMLGFCAAGLVAHTLYLGYRGYSAESIPLSSAFDWYLLAAWVLALSYLYLTFYHQQAAFGVFILPLVLGLIGLAEFADAQPFAREPASQVWGIVHGAFLLAGTVAATIGFAAGLMYLVQTYRLKHKQPMGGGLRLPSLEWLETTASRAIVVSVLTLGIGLAAGVVLNIVNHQKEVDTIAWADPVIIGSGSMFACMLIATGISAWYRPAHAGQKVAYLTIFTFVMLLIALGVVLLAPTDHGRARETAQQPERIEASLPAAAGPSAIAAVSADEWLAFHRLSIATNRPSA